jgi:uncharacterized protein YceK
MTARAVPAVLLVPLLIVAIVISSSACGTLANLDGGGGMFMSKSVAPIPLPYGGVANDVKWSIEKPSAIPFAAFDLCLSLIADTFTLPIVVVADIRVLSDWIAGRDDAANPAETGMPTVPRAESRPPVPSGPNRDKADSPR